MESSSSVCQQNGCITPVQQMISSCSGALVTSCFTTPLDVLKVRLQAQQKLRPMNMSSFQIKRSANLLKSLCLCTHCTTHLYDLKRQIHPLASIEPQIVKGARAVLVNIVQGEGVGALWSGLPATVLMSVPATIIYFTAYDHLKYKMGYNEKVSSTIYIPMVAGSLARVLATTLVSPWELIRTKMQSTRLSYRELSAAIRISVHNNGFLFMMRGLGPSLMRDVPFSAIYWLGYESTKSYYMRKYNGADPTPSMTFVGGALSGTIAALITLPFDVIKTHKQMELGDAMCRHQKITPTWKLIIDLYRSRGITALYAGIIPRIIKVAPACAIMITIYESGKSFFRNQNNAKSSLNGR